MKIDRQKICGALFGLTAALFFAACIDPLETSPQMPSGAAGGGKTGWVLVGIVDQEEGAADPAASPQARTLLPSLGVFYYKLEFTQQGRSEPALTQTISGTTLTQELDPGNYTLTVTAYKTGTTVAVAGGDASLEVLAGQVVSVTVPLALTLEQTGTGFLNYAVTLPQEITLTEGSLTLYPLSGDAAAVTIDVSGGLGGSETIPSGYYRLEFSIGGTIGGAGKFAAKTSVLRISDSLTTTVSYILTVADFNDTDAFYTAGNETEFASVLSAIRAAPETFAAISVTGDFSSPPVSLADMGYSGKTITLRGTGGGVREISLASQGSLFTVGAASSEPVLILQDITLKGISGNNAALVRVDKGALIMEGDSLVTGNTNNGYTGIRGGGVYVAGGTFAMKGSAAVSGNAVTIIRSSASNVYSYGGGVYVAGGTFAMEDSAVVSRNTVSASGTGTSNVYSYGGGVR